MKKSQRTQHKNAEKPKELNFFTKKRILTYLGIWSFCGLWIVLTQASFPSRWKESRTTEKVEGLIGLIEKFKKSRKKAPESLAILRDFALDEGDSFDAYDAYGNRLIYSRLDSKHYYVRSLGIDEVQNHPGIAPDQGRIRWGAFPKNPALTYDPKPETTPALYPAVLLEGADSTDGTWHARIYNDRELRQRQLLVRQKQTNGIFMVAPHDRIEEFFWVPEKNQLVYSVTGSKSARDGIYLWDLNKDQYVEILAASNISPSEKTATRGSFPRATKLWITLAGITSPHPKIFGFASERHDGGLDVREFFRAERFFVVTLPHESEPVPEINGSQDTDVTPFSSQQTSFPSLQSLLQAPYVASVSIKGTPYLNVQRQFQALPLKGDPETVLLKWNHFADRGMRSPLFPYALWVLTSLYAQGHDRLLPQANKDAEVLRAFGTEIANALLNDALAPSYLKSVALDAHQRLMTGSPLPYRLGGLSDPSTVLH